MLEIDWMSIYLLKLISIRIYAGIIPLDITILVLRIQYESIKKVESKNKILSNKAVIFYGWD
jgi:hypothetical protein